MPKRVTPELEAELCEIYDRPLGPEEYAARANRPIPPEEMAEMVALIDWFLRRYPTVKERLDYVRSRTAAWRRRD